MLGAIIGDIVGSRYEFDATNDYNFELFSDKNNFTDDTICTVAIADAILKGRDYGESLHDWCRRYMSPKGGFGGRFRQWVLSDHPQPYGSFGNGSAMRVSPIGMYFRDDNEVIEQAKLSAACTHNHPMGIKGAQAVAWAIHCAIDSGDGLVTPKTLQSEIIDITICTASDFGLLVQWTWMTTRTDSTKPAKVRYLQPCKSSTKATVLRMPFAEQSALVPMLTLWELLWDA